MADIDYNDGKWHGWNGGECPVHPESEVECICTTDAKPVDMWAIRLHAGRASFGSSTCAIRAFRVTKAYVEPPKPREFWLYRDSGNGFDVLDREPELHWDEVIHVREVID